MRSNVFELLEKINRIARQPEFPLVSKLEKDLLRQYLRELYDTLDEPEAEALVFTPEQQETVKVPQVETIQPEELIAASVNTEEPVKQKPVEVTTEPHREAEKVQSSVKVSINEIVKPNATLNERVKGPGREIHKHFSAKPLKEMIDLNRRFVFVNELFGGNADALNKAVLHIDSLQDYREAYSYTTATLAPENNWDEKAQPVKLFFKLLKQKFGEE